MYEIEKGIPIPQQNKGVRIYPFPTMEVGDSFLVLDGGRNKAVSALVRFKKHNATRKFTVRTQPDGSLRIWRIE